MSIVVALVVAEHGPASDGPAVEWFRSRARQLIGSRGGVTVDRGAMCAASFTSCTAAVQTAVAMQQTLADKLSLAVGIALGEGSGAVDDVSATIDEALSIAARAAPGQILVSAAVAALVARSLPNVETRSDVALADDAAERFSECVALVWRSVEARDVTRVVVAEDVPLIRAGIVALLRDEGFDVCGEAGDRDELIAVARRTCPDLVITDVRMPPAQRDEGLRAVLELRSERPSLAVLVVSQHVEVSAADLLLDGRIAGVGYLLKERVSDLDEFVDACRTVAAGGVVIDPLVTEQLLRRSDSSLDRLTEREREVLDLMARGRSNAAIARELACSQKTLETHVRAIFTKLDLAEHPDDHRRVAAVVRYLHGNG
jgi:DNA-binding NarL/FixJ family response regulator